MKHIYLLIFTFSLFSFSYAQNIDSSFTDYWNGNSWVSNSRDIYSYNSSCQIESQLAQYFNQTTNVWVNSVVFLTTYKPLQHTSETKVWDGASNAFSPISRTTTNYIAPTKIYQVLQEQWLAGKWDTTARTTYEYGSDEKITKITSENHDSIWREVGYSLFTYNNDGTEENVLGFAWNPVTLQWTMNSRSKTVYDKVLRQKDYISESWEVDHWVKQFHDLQEYDSNDKLIKEFQQFGDAALNVWINFGRATFSYNADGTRRETVTELWQQGTQIWEKGNRTTYVYEPLCTLPLTLLSFNGTKQNSKIILSWRVADQQNTSHFNIQRSFNGTSFSTIGFLKAKASGQAVYHYSFSDDDPSNAPNKLFYRLQIVDNDNSSRFSNVIHFQGYANNLITVLPNPVTDLLKVKISVPSSFSIYSITGILQQAGKLKEGTNDINVSALAKGMYLLKLIDNYGGVNVQKIVVQ